MSDDEQEAGYGLVMPFVVTESEGGPYNDVAFVAGWTCAAIDEALSHSGTSWSGYVPPGILPQLDLIAMRRHLVVTQEPWEGHEAEWTLVTIGLPNGSETDEP